MSKVRSGAGFDEVPSLLGLGAETASHLEGGIFGKVSAFFLLRRGRESKLDKGLWKKTGKIMARNLLKYNTLRSVFFGRRQSHQGLMERRGAAQWSKFRTSRPNEGAADGAAGIGERVSG